MNMRTSNPIMAIHNKYNLAVWLHSYCHVLNSKIYNVLHLC